MNMNALRFYCQRYRYVPVGAAVGEAVGEAVGAAVGVAVGDAVGDAVGWAVGTNVGDSREMKVSVYIKGRSYNNIYI